VTRAEVVAAAAAPFSRTSTLAVNGNLGVRRLSSPTNGLQGAIARILSLIQQAGGHNNRENGRKQGRK
jgi:hypothetical protein